MEQVSDRVSVSLELVGCARSFPNLLPSLAKLNEVIALACPVKYLLVYLPAVTVLSRNCW